MSKETAMGMLQQQAPPQNQTTSQTIPSTEQKEIQSQTTSNTSKDDLNSQRLALIAKKEASFLKERETYKKEMEAFKKEREDFQKDREIALNYKQKGEQFDSLLSKDPVQALKLAGFTEAQIVKLIAEAQDVQVNPVEEAKKIAVDEINKLKDELKKEKEENLKSRNERLFTDYKDNIKKTIQNDKENFKYCNFEGQEAESLAYEFMEMTFKNSGNKDLISYKEAAEMAEDYYQTRDELRQSLRTSKVESTAQTNNPQTTMDVVRGQNARSAPSSNASVRSRTLSNSVTATSAGAASANPDKRETPSQKRARLIAMLKS